MLTIYAHPRSDPRPRQEAVRLPGTRKSCGDWALARVANVLGVDFSGLIAWMMWRALNLSLIPGAERKLRIMLDWGLDLIFPKDIVEIGIGTERDRRR